MPQHTPNAAEQGETSQNPENREISVHVVDRLTIESEPVLHVPHVLISICDPGAREAKVFRNGKRLGLLRLRFHDAEPVKGYELPEHIVLMTAADAVRIWQFVAEWRDQIQAILVHCEAGMSRSPAVAGALAKRFGPPGNADAILGEYQPNQHVYRLMMATARTVKAS